MRTVVLALALLAPAARAAPPEPVPADADAPDLARVVVYTELSSWYMVTRPGVGVDVRLASLADGRVHLLADVGLGATSHYLATPQPRVTATLGLFTGRGGHHAALHLGGDLITNTLSDTGPYTYPVLAGGYRWQKPGSGLSWSVLAGTTGLGGRVGWGW